MKSTFTSRNSKEQSCENKIKMVPTDHLFCDKIFAKITSDIRIVWKFISECVINEQSIDITFVFLSVTFHWWLWCRFQSFEFVFFTKKAGQLDTFLNNLCSRNLAKLKKMAINCSQKKSFFIFENDFCTKSDKI